MSTIPNKKRDRIAFYQSHAPVWAAKGEDIGVDPLVAADLGVSVTATNAAYQALLAARDAAQAAQTEFDQKYRNLSLAGASLIKTIRAYAQGVGGDLVYVWAQIPPPKTPSPLPPPGTPYSPGVQLLPGGALKMSWRCKTPADRGGTVYEVHRQSGTGPSVHVGTTGEKNFTDQTIEAGTAQVTYTIVPVRSTARGVGAQFNVQFGAGGAGQAQSLPMIAKAA